MAEADGKLPLAFEANVGRAEPTVAFRARGAGYRLLLTASEAVLAPGQRVTVDVATTMRPGDATSASPPPANRVGRPR